MSGRVDLDAMREIAERMGDDPEYPRAEFVAAPAPPPMQHNPRLDACRDRASRIVAAGLAAGLIVRTEDMDTNEAIEAMIGARLESMAHALLAAEREQDK